LFFAMAHLSYDQPFMLVVVTVLVVAFRLHGALAPERIGRRWPRMRSSTGAAAGGDSVRLKFLPGRGSLTGPSGTLATGSCPHRRCS
jgi:hypothetical protein